jgi:hypothetical protein
MSRYALPIAALFGFALSGIIFAAHAADRLPNAAEKTSIESTFKAAGYVTWEEIEFDDGVWEVDDARKEAGAVDYDIKISPDNWKVVTVRED